MTAAILSAVEKQRVYARRHYEKNMVTMKARSAAHRTLLRSAIRKLLLDHLKEHPCIDCGEANPIVLEFDHHGEKKFNLGAATADGYSVAAVRAEIGKCDVRCANCHRIKTYRERGFTHRGVPA